MLETTIPRFNLKVTKRQLRRKLEEHGPKKPAAIPTLQHFRGAFVFVHEQENKRGNDGQTDGRRVGGREKMRTQRTRRLCYIPQHWLTWGRALRTAINPHSSSP